MVNLVLNFTLDKKCNVSETKTVARQISINPQKVKKKGLNQTFLSVMDKDGDGVISKEEWSEWCKKQLEFEIEDTDDAACVEKMFLADQKQIEDNFQKLDIDGDGQIDISEI